MVGVVEYDRDWTPFDNTTWNKQYDYENGVNGEDDSVNSMDGESSDYADDAILATWKISERIMKNQNMVKLWKNRWTMSHFSDPEPWHW